MKQDKYYVYRTTPKDPDKVEVSNINNSRFEGTKETFINLNNNLTHLYRATDGSIVDVKEISNKRTINQPKIMGCYEIPEDSDRRGDGNFLLVEKQAYFSVGGGFTDVYEDEWKVRIFSATPNTKDCIGGVDESILGMSGAELREIVKYSDEKHGQTLVIKIRKKDDGYRVKCDNNNACLENSDDIISGKIPVERQIPSARDLAFQNSSNYATQYEKAKFVEY